MYCHNCGNDTRPDANFCDNCGTPQFSQEKQTDEARPVLTVRPFFSPLVTLIKQIPLQLLITAWGAAVFGIAGYFIIKYLDLDLYPWFFAILFGCLFFFITPVVVLFRMTHRYAKTEYRFYKNRLEYSEGAFIVGDTSISYDGIIEINMIRGIFSRLFRLGTIVLSTAATGDIISHSRRNILIQDIEYPEVVYRKIRHLINK